MDAGGAGMTMAAATNVIIKHICVDAGHGGDDKGGKTLGTPESGLVLPYAVELAQVLRGRGHTVTLTRSTDVFVELRKRASIANNANADLFVSVHANASNNSSVKGPWTIHAKGSTTGQSFAKRMQRALVSVMGGSLNAVYPDQTSWVSGRRLAVLRQTAMPAVLLELGFMTNPIEIRKMEDPGTRARICRALADELDQIPK